MEKEPAMQPETKTGTFKRLGPHEVAAIVKIARTNREWKQFALAHEAGVTERTIERVEAGKRVSDETLQKIAKALSLAEGVFTDPIYCPSQEELAAIARKAKEDYTHTPMHDLSSPRDLENVLGAHAYLVDGTAVDDELADDIAAVRDQVQDCGDLYDDVSYTEKLGFCRELLTMIREIEAHGYTTRWGRYSTDDKFNVGVLAFLKTSDLQSGAYFRHAIVPRSLMRSAAGEIG